MKIYAINIIEGQVTSKFDDYQPKPHTIGYWKGFTSLEIQNIRDRWSSSLEYGYDSWR